METNMEFTRAELETLFLALNVAHETYQESINDKFGDVQRLERMLPRFRDLSDRVFAVLVED